MRPSDDIVAAEPEQRRQRRRRRRPATTLTNGQRAAAEAAQSSPSLPPSHWQSSRLSSLSLHIRVCVSVYWYFFCAFFAASAQPQSGVSAAAALRRAFLLCCCSILTTPRNICEGQQWNRQRMSEPGPVLPEPKKRQIIQKNAKRSYQYYKKLARFGG